MSPKQKTIILFAHKNDGYISKQEAVEQIGGFYYNNADKYVGEVLSRMVKAGILVRFKIGHYKLNDTFDSKQPTAFVHPNQLLLEF